MMFNPTLHEIVVFLLICLAVYVWAKHGRRLRRWWHDFFRQRRGPRNLKSKSPAECPQCNRDIYLLPHRLKLDVLPWPERKSPRGRPKTIDTSGHAYLNPSCDYFAIADPAIHALVSNGRRGKQQSSKGNPCLCPILGQYLAELPPKRLDLSRYFLSIIFSGTTDTDGNNGRSSPKHGRFPI